MLFLLFLFIDFLHFLLLFVYILLRACCSAILLFFVSTLMLAIFLFSQKIAISDMYFAISAILLFNQN